MAYGFQIAHHYWSFSSDIIDHGSEKVNSEVTFLNAFTFHFQVEKLVKALKEYYSSQGRGNSDTQKTGGGDTSQVKYFSIYKHQYSNTNRTLVTVEPLMRLQTFFLQGG